MSDDTPTLDQFEDKLNQLDELVRALESGDIKLEEAVRNFERGMALSSECDKLLKQAELRVQQLTRTDQGDGELAELDQDADA